MRLETGDVMRPMSVMNVCASPIEHSKESNHIHILLLECSDNEHVLSQPYTGGLIIRRHCLKKILTLSGR